jgi:DNA-binding MarR family transcriptional regulator
LRHRNFNAIATLKPSDSKLNEFIKGLTYARESLGADITAQRLLILINVYLHEGLSQADLLKQLSSTSVTALSRNLAELSTLTPRKTQGLGLIELRLDPFNLRRKRVFLTPNGRLFIKHLRRGIGSI